MILEVFHPLVRKGELLMLLFIIGWFKPESSLAAEFVYKFMPPPMGANFNICISFPPLRFSMVSLSSRVGSLCPGLIISIE